MNQGDSAIDEHVELGINPDEDDLSEMGDTLEQDNYRDRVRLVSCEYTVPSKVKVMRGDEGIGTLNGAIYDEEDQGMAFLVEQGHASLYDAVKMVIWKMIFCGNYVLQNRKRIYRHQRFSLVPVWAYRKKLNNSPYGTVKNVMDPQDDLNKRHSKALFILSTKQSIVQKNAVDDHDAFVEERDRPDGHMVVNDVAGVEIREDRGLAREHVMLMDQDKAFIESISGVTDEARGIETNASSGVAMRSREQQAHVTTAELFDNYRFAFQMSGEIQLSLIEQFYTDEKVIRVAGEKGGLEFIKMNMADEYGEIENDITATQSDFIVEADAYHASVRQAMFESFGGMITKLPPEISLQLLDLWIDLSDLPGKDVMVDRIRAINGQRDPDEDQEDPEVQARLQAEAEEAQKQKEIEERMVELEMALKDAEIGEKDAEAEKDRADAQAKIAKIRHDMELLRIKRAEVLAKIEATEQAAKEPEPTAVGVKPKTKPIKKPIKKK